MRKLDNLIDCIVVFIYKSTWLLELGECERRFEVGLIRDEMRLMGSSTVGVRWRLPMAGDTWVCGCCCRRSLEEISRVMRGGCKGKS